MALLEFQPAAAETRIISSRIRTARCRRPAAFLFGEDSHDAPSRLAAAEQAGHELHRPLGVGKESLQAITEPVQSGLAVARERLTRSDFNQFPGSWSPDGKKVALVEVRPGTRRGIAVLEVGSGRVTPFLNSPFNEQFPEFSPDGRWMAYSSDESKRNEVYVQPFPGPGTKYPVSAEGGEQPLWARDSKQLFYRWEDQIWVVDVRTDGAFATSKPRLLLKHPGYYISHPIRSYDLSLDSQRFLMMKLEQRTPTPVTEMILVQNWFEELKRLVPTGKK